MSLLEEKAARAASDMANMTGVPRAAALDPLTLLAILDLIVTVVADLVKCYRGDHKRAAARARRPGVLGRLIVLAHARTCLKRSPEAEAYPSEAADAVLSLGGEITAEEFATLAGEVETRGRR